MSLKPTLSEHSKNRKRLFYLDNLRSFALLLGLVFHVAIVYAAEIKYPLRNEERSEFFDVFGEWVHVFRMPLFFFLSGYFTEAIFRAKPLKDFLRMRIFRIFIPTVVGVLLFAPMQSYISLLQDGERISYLDFYIQIFLNGNIRPSHLWFLYFLILFTILHLFVRKATLPLTALLKKEPAQKGFAQEWKTITVFTFISFAGTCMINLYFMKDESRFAIEPVNFVYNYTFFLCGSLLISKEKLLLEPQSDRFWIWAPLALLTFWGFYEISRIDPFWSYFGYTGDWRRILHILSKCAAGWLMIRLLIGLFQKFFDFKNEQTEYMRTASLPIYLVHHPVSLLAGYFVVHTSLGLAEKFVLHLFLVFSITFAIYHFLIRPFRWVNLVLGNQTQAKKNP
ncbi:acyltransferase family protein [Leptospira sp. FAT2]|uniref:acyltransferase family protein n=1 Tax=Leptospira sanjuanensis TaxID=2879643 RepID=UPI001EE80031|nr:acyltransferase family protein [Leptospira sanjuanensis]MCG6192446.1 acyltransferase family protein [Leptospira sanjuanensis]